MIEYSIYDRLRKVLNENVHISLDEKRYLNVAYDRILSTRGLSVDASGNINLSDQLIANLKNNTGDSTISTGFIYNTSSVSFEDNNSYILSNDIRRDILGRTQTKLNDKCDFLSVDIKDYSRFLMIHQIFIKLHYADVDFIGATTRSELKDRKYYNSLSYKDKNEYIRKILTDDVWIELDMSKIKTTADLFVALTHEFSHIHLLCSANRRTIEDIDFDNPLIDMLDNPDAKEIIDNYTVLYNRIQYYLIPDECTARISSIEKLLYDKDYQIPGNFEKYFKEHKMSESDAIHYMFDYICDKIPSIRFIQAEKFLIFASEKELFNKLIEKSYDVERAGNILQKVVAFKLIFALNRFNSYRMKELNVSKDEMIYYLTEDVSVQSFIDELDYFNSTKHYIFKKDIDKMLNAYETYITKIYSHLRFYYHHYVICDEEDTDDRERKDGHKKSFKFEQR